MADVSSNVQILGDSMSECSVCVSLPANADTATIDLGAFVQAGQSGNRVAIIGIQSCGSYSMAWDADTDYTFFYGNGTINIPRFISPIIMDQAKTGTDPTGDIIITSTEPGGTAGDASGVISGEANGVFIMLRLQKIAGYKGTTARFSKVSGNVASHGIGGY